MKIAVAGTGYVGLSIATLLSQHHEVMAVDIVPEKVEKINNKISPIQDEYIEQYLAEKDLNLTATLDAEAAYKDADFVVIAAPTNYDAPVHKITIIPRTSGALGYTMQVDDGEHYLMSKEELENKIATFTGGRAAEELIFHSITTGASNDIEQATKIARAMISRYGMSDDFDMVAMESVSNQYLGGDSSLTCSFETQTMLDKKVVELVRKQHEKALKILQDNIGKLHELAQYLYEHETITGEEFMKILETPTPVVEDTLKTSEEETDKI